MGTFVNTVVFLFFKFLASAHFPDMARSCFCYSNFWRQHIFLHPGFEDDDNDNVKVRKVVVMPKISAASTATIVTQWEKAQSTPVGTLKEKKELFKE